MKIVLIVIVLLAIAFAGLAIKVIFTKDRQLEKSCCGKTLNKDASCGCSGQ